MRWILCLCLLCSCGEGLAFPQVEPARREAMLAPPTGRVDVVIDTDLTNEIDDEFALVWALLSPERLHIEAVYAAPNGYSAELLATGTSELDARILLGQLDELGLSVDDVPVKHPSLGMRSAFRRAEEILALMDSDVPAFRGSATYLPDGFTPVESDAATDLVERARRDREGPLYVVSLGAITNVASALLMAPDIVGDIVVVWTSAYPTFWDRPNASYNLAQDVDAARIILESGVPFVYVPGFYVGEELRVTLPEMTEYVAEHGPAGEFLYELYVEHPLVGGHFARSKVLWDLVAFAWLLDARWLQTDLVPTPTLDRDLRWVDVGAPPMREATDVWRDALFEDFYRKLDAHAGFAPEP